MRNKQLTIIHHRFLHLPCPQDYLPNLLMRVTTLLNFSGNRNSCINTLLFYHILPYHPIFLYHPILHLHPPPSPEPLPPSLPPGRLPPRNIPFSPPTVNDPPPPPPPMSPPPPSNMDSQLSLPPRPGQSYTPIIKNILL